MSKFIVRVELADRPGALGAVASRIGAVRGDVVGVEILDRRDGRALDDFLVELPDDAVQLVVAEVEEVDGAVVEVVHQVRSTMADGRREVYDGAAEFVAARSPNHALQLLAGLARRELCADWSAVVDAEPSTGAGGEISGSGGDFVVLCHDGAAPAGGRGLAKPLEFHGKKRLPAPDVAWAPMAAWDLTIVVGRPGRRFARVERERLAALARLGDARWTELSRSRSRDEHPARAG